MLDDVVIEDGLSKYSEGSVLLLNTQLQSFLVYINVFDLGNVAYRFGLVIDPGTELGVWIVFTFSIFVFVGTIDMEALFEVIWQLLCTGLDRGLGRVDSPLDIFVLVTMINFLGFSIDATSEFVVTSSVHIDVAIFAVSILRIVVATIRAAIIAAVTILAVLVALSLLPGLALGFFSRLVFLAFLARSVFENEGAQLEARIDDSALTTSFAVKADIIFNVNFSLGILALFAKNKSVNEAVEIIL